MGQIITTQNLVAIKEVRHAGQQGKGKASYSVPVNTLGWDKMVNIMQTTFSSAVFFFYENDYILIKKIAGDEPISEPIMA